MSTPEGTKIISPEEVVVVRKGDLTKILEELSSLKEEVNRLKSAPSTLSNQPSGDTPIFASRTSPQKKSVEAMLNELEERRIKQRELLDPVLSRAAELAILDYEKYDAKNRKST